MWSTNTAGRKLLNLYSVKLVKDLLALKDTVIPEETGQAFRNTCYRCRNLGHTKVFNWLLH